MSGRVRLSGRGGREREGEMSVLREGQRGGNDSNHCRYGLESAAYGWWGAQLHSISSGRQRQATATDLRRRLNGRSQRVARQGMRRAVMALPLRCISHWSLLSLTSTSTSSKTTSPIFSSSWMLPSQSSGGSIPWSPAGDFLPPPPHPLPHGPQVVHFLFRIPALCFTFF
jgi:hypothetical protein